MLGIQRYLINSSCIKGALDFVEEADMETNEQAIVILSVAPEIEFVLLTWPWAGVGNRMRKLLSRAPWMCIITM